MKEKLDDIKEPLCTACINLFDWPTCMAFPDGIPDDILLGTFDHTNSWPKSKEYPLGDHGVKFKSY